MKAESRTRALVLPSALAVLLVVPSALADAPAEREAQVFSRDHRQFHPIARLEVHGNVATRFGTIASLLPVSLPARLSASQVEEFERRLNNLEIFDEVRVVVVGDVLDVTVREKWTLTPSVDFATGKTARDLYLSLGATEYNFLGTASIVGAEVSYEQRRPNGSLWFEDHPFGADRLGLAGGVYIASGSYRFEIPEAEWTKNQSGAWFGAKLPYPYELPVRTAVFLGYYYERISDLQGPVRAPSGHGFGPMLEVTWDRFQWHDLTPTGARVELELSQNAFVPASLGERATGRYSASTTALVAWSWGDRFVATARGVADAYSRGNANHSALLGSVAGVRGLADAFHRNHLQAYVNAEVRYAIPLLRRLALQPVAFSDAAVFRPFDAAGSAGPWQQAACVGVGVRLIPTFLTRLLLRVDLARLVFPREDWFVQFGVTQYFGDRDD